jgi:membrane protein required for colicin V production
MNAEAAGLMLTWLDIVLLAIVAISALMGLWRGFIVEVMALLVWALAFWLATRFGPAVAELYATVVDYPTARWLLGYASVFLAALAVGGLATWLLRKLIKGSGLSGSDRILGLGFGLLRGAAVACLVVLVAGFTPLPQEAAWREGRLIPGFVSGAQWLQTWLPQAMAEHVSFDPARLALPLPEILRDNDEPETTTPLSPASPSSDHAPAPPPDS